MTQAATTPGQLSLFAEIGVDALPSGMAGLSQKEQRFVLAYLRTGLASAAAREAGYADPEADACKIRKRPQIVAVVTQAREAAAGNARALAADMWQRAQAYRAEWAEIYPELRALRAKGLPMPCSEEDKCQAIYLQRLNFLEGRERAINAELAKIEATLKGVEITAAVDMTVRRVGPEETALIEHLNAQLAQREVSA